MRYPQLGNTGIKVSELCFGSLALSEAQYNLTPEESRALLEYAWERGIRFFDTAELYGTYGRLKMIAQRPGVVVASRCYAATREEMGRSFDLCRRELGRDSLDIFGLHEQESGLTLKGHREALDFLCDQKEKGLLRAVLVSTHHVECVKAAAMLDSVDVVFAILNVDGLGIRGGTRQDMEAALQFAKSMGKGVYLMKALGGGHLYRDACRALAYARDFAYKDSVCVGLKDPYEVEFASRVLEGQNPPPKREQAEAPRQLVVEDWCARCGECVRRCPFGALSLGDESAVVDRTKCMLCGYCARACPHFCLKVV